LHPAAEVRSLLRRRGARLEARIAYRPRGGEPYVRRVTLVPRPPQHRAG
jgi:hypothetical protein